MNKRGSAKSALILALSFSLLVSAFTFSHVSVVSAVSHWTADKWVNQGTVVDLVNDTYARGKDFQVSYDPAAKTYTWTSTPLWIRDGTWKPYAYSDKHAAKGYYEVRTAYIGARIYDTYAAFYDPEMKEVRVTSEQWFLQHYNDKLEEWRDAPLSNLKWSVFQTGNYIEIVKTWNTAYSTTTGMLEIRYKFDGSLKHTVTWTNTTEAWLEPRFEQYWTGIAGESVTTEKALTATLTEKETVFSFKKSDGSISVLENQHSAIGLLNSSEVDMSAGQKKARFTFSGFNLTEPIVLDPETSTYTVFNDGYTYGYSSNYSTALGTGYAVSTTDDTLTVGQSLSGNNIYVYRLFLNFNTTAIPSDVTATTAELRLFGDTDGSTTDFTYNLQNWTGAPELTTDDHTAYDGVNYCTGVLDTSSFLDNGYNNITINNLTLIRKAGNTTICVRSSREISENDPSGDEYVSVCASEWEVSVPNTQPILSVTYTVDSTAPTYSNISTNSTATSEPCGFSCCWNDDLALSHYIFSTNNTGSWTNDTATAFSDTPAWANITKTLNATEDLIIGYQWFANDTANNWNSTTIQTLTTTAAESSTFTVSFSAAPSNPLINVVVIFTVSVAYGNGSACSNYELNVTRDGELWKQNYTETTFTDTEVFPQSHTYNVSALYADSAEVTDYTATALTVTWQLASSGGGSLSGANPTPTPLINETQSILPDIDVNNLPLTTQDIFIVTGIILVSILVSLTISTRKNRPKIRKFAGLKSNRRKKKGSFL